jgi:hypothetical protein
MIRAAVDRGHQQQEWKWIPRPLPVRLLIGAIVV